MMADLHLRRTSQKDSLTMVRDRTGAARWNSGFPLRITPEGQRLIQRALFSNEEQRSKRIEGVAGEGDPCWEGLQFVQSKEDL